ncbi:hydrogenase-4 component B [mine drainage metagenome]|uniref:Hydrogenase-4 component B n=1 Tax=mine drainage metagenome TaxID=410659 RepID=A0A1J5S3T9_9ZZZZ
MSGADQTPLLLAYAAVLCTLLSGVISLAAVRRHPGFLHLGSFLLLFFAAAASIAAGAWVLLANLTLTDRQALGLPWLAWHVRIDPLSGFFLVLLGTLVAAISLYGPSYTREFARGKAAQPLPPLGVFTALFVLGMQMLLLADDALLFMISWEMMSLSGYFLVVYQHQHAANRNAAFLYLLLAHVGALVILLSFGVLAAFGGGLTFDLMRAAKLTPLWATIAFACAFAGFGIKAGMVPLHVWLPDAHPAAPSHISAMMSGAMIKMGIYGIVRLSYDLIGDVRWEWGVVMLVIGTASSLLGVLYALMQHDLKRLLAYHSIENIGIILMGLGMSMIFLGTGHKMLGTLGLVAALYHTLNHALFKGLLFLGAGSVLYRTHERDLERMGGLIQRMPVTAFLFLVGSVAISALPPFNGFVSEWLTFQTALQAPALTNGLLRAMIPIAAALLALTGALAAACFVKAFGIAFLGRPRTRRVARAREVPAGMLGGMGLLALLCLLLGVFPTTMIEVMAPITQLLVHAALPSAAAQGWLWLTPISPQVASYSAPFVLAAIVVVFGLGYLFLKRGAAPVRRADAWDCGFGQLTHRMQYTSTAFSQPIRRVFAGVWKVEEQVDSLASAGPIPRVTSLHYSLHTQDWSWLRCYVPIGRLVLAAANRIGFIQTGNIHTYLKFSFATLLVFLWIVS